MAPLPDFQSLSPKQKEGVYQYVEEKLRPFSVRFAHRALAYGDTGPDLQPLRDISYEVYREEYWVHHLPVQTLVIAAVCQYQVVTSLSYANFHPIDDLRQVLLDQYMERTGVSGIVPQWKVYQDSSWEGGAPAFLCHIPVDDEIKGLYEIYTNHPIAASVPSDSSTGSLFRNETSDSSTGSLFDKYE
jgi:hypothetical protein